MEPSNKSSFPVDRWVGAERAGVASRRLGRWTGSGDLRQEAAKETAVEAKRCSGAVPGAG